MTDSYIPWWVPSDHPCRAGAEPIPEQPPDITIQPEPVNALDHAEAIEDAAQANGR